MASDASGSGSDGESGNSSSAAALLPADQDGISVKDDGDQGSEGENGSEVDELDDPEFVSNLHLTDRGWRRALTSENTVMPRPNRRPTRAEKGTYADNADLFQEITDIARRVPEDQPVYDLRTLAPDLYEPRSEELESLMAKGEDKFNEFLKKSGRDEANMEAVGLRPILNWTVRMRLDTTGAPNPVNRKVVCSVYLKELQEQRGLTDDALQHIARVAGPRYNPNTGLLRMSSEVFPKREENRIHLMDLINNLVEEGDRVHPAPGGLNSMTPTERKEEAFDEHFAALWDELNLKEFSSQEGAQLSPSEGSSSGSKHSDGVAPAGHSRNARGDEVAHDSSDGSLATEETHPRP